MKKIFFNATFTLGFVLTFFILINLFSSTLVNAFIPGSITLSEDDQLDIDGCQNWTEKVRAFDVKAGQEAEEVTVLMYHKIMDDDQINESHYTGENELNETIVLTSEFEKQMNWLHENGYVTLTAAEFEQFMKKKLEVPKKSVLITFDDGFKNNVEEAYPILKEYGYTAINFVITSNITKNHETYDPSGHQYVSVEDMESSCDVFDYQSHTYDFHQRTEDGVAFLVEEEEEAIRKDLESSFTNLNRDPQIFSYPYGQYDEETLKAVESLGVSMAFTVHYEDAKPGTSLFEIPRKTVFPTDRLEDFRKKVNGE